MRCFVALELPEAARAELARWASACRLALAGAFAREGKFAPSWTRAEGYHATLAFLGEIEGGRLEAAEAALDAVAGSGAIRFSFSGLTGFPSEKRWRVLAAAMSDGGRAEACRRLLAAALPAAASASEGRDFSPHITLARLRSRGRAPGIPAIPAPDASWTIDRCGLYKSELRGGGAVYTELRGVALSGFAPPLKRADDAGAYRPG